MRAAPAVEHDNVLVMHFGEGVRSLGFRYSGDHDIVYSQPLGRVRAQIHGASLLLHVHAGRRRSPQVGSSWRAALHDDDRHMFGLYTQPGTMRPSSLNFWVGGELLVNEVPVGEEFYFAQGSNWLSNNWWLGSLAGAHDVRDTHLRFTDIQGRAYCAYSLWPNEVQVRACPSVAGTRNLRHAHVSKRQ